MTTDEQIQFWDENGYLKFGKVLEQGEVAELLAGLDRIVRIESEECDDSSIEFSIGHDRGGEGGAYGEAITQHLNLWKRDAAYDRTVRHPLITGIAKQLLKSPELRLWHDHVISKPPGGNDRFQFHQDFYNWPLADPNILTCWIALDDATVAKRKLQGRERNRVEICFRKNPQSSHNASTRRARRRAFAGSTELCNASFRAQTDEVRRKRPHPACPP